jgi:hypothetical protein
MFIGVADPDSLGGLSPRHLTMPQLPCHVGTAQPPPETSIFPPAHSMPVAQDLGSNTLTRYAIRIHSVMSPSFASIYSILP